MIWGFIFFLLIIAEILLFFYLPESNFRELLLILVGIFIGAIGFSFKEMFKEIKVKKKIKQKYISLGKDFNRFFSNTLTLNYIPLNTLNEDLSENELLDELLENNIQPISRDVINNYKLCYYCKKWETTKNAGDYDLIKKIADSIGVKYATLNPSVKSFLNYYEYLILKKIPINYSIRENTQKEFRGILKSFINSYYKDLQFFEIRDSFNQNKNLHETLIEIIKEGKLSNYGITEETLARLKKDISRHLSISNIFLIITNNTSIEDKKILKEYLHKYPRFGMVGKSSKMPENSVFGIYIIKTNKNKTAKGVLKDLKREVKVSSEMVVRVIPINFLEEEMYSLPFNQSFVNENLRKGYEVIEWFKTGFDYSDSAIWSEITKSSITTQELLSIIPFNIFCKGILPCEQEFIIKKYPLIKAHFNINILGDWEQVKKDNLALFILSLGTPIYPKEVLKEKFGVQKDEEKDEKIKKRINEISDQIIKGAEKFNKSLKPLSLGE